MKQVLNKIMIILLILLLDFSLIFYFYCFSNNNTQKEKLNVTKNLLLSLKNENDDILLEAMQEKISTRDSHVASRKVVEI